VSDPTPAKQRAAVLGLAVFVTFVAAKVAAVPMQPGTPAFGWPRVVADDALLAVLFGLCAWVVPVWLARTSYVAVCLYTTFNVGVVLAIGSPLVGPMLHGVDPAMLDSVRRYLEARILLPMAAVMVVAALAPCLASRLARRVRVAGCALVALTATGALLHQPLAPAQRNAIVAMVRSGIPLHAALPTVAPAIPMHAAQRVVLPPAITRLAATAAGRSVVLVILESAAPRFLGAYGASEDAMPFVSSLAQHSLLCTEAWAVYPESIKGQIALLHSTAPAPDLSAEQHGRIPVPGLPRLMAAHGYRSALFHSGRFRFLGMQAVISASGFDMLVDAADIGGEHQSSFGVDEESTVTALLAWIDSLPAKQPFLAAYLPVAGHHPYGSPAGGPFPYDDMLGCYRNALHYADRCVRHLWEGICQRRGGESLVLCVVGDHGQAFGEHAGNFGHSFALYEENLAVPLLFHAPGLTEPGCRYTHVASHLDVAPTLLDVLGLPACVEFQGTSLLQATTRPALAFTDWGDHLVALRDGHRKSIHDLRTGTSLLFDLVSDPREQHDIAGTARDYVGEQRHRAVMWIQATHRNVSRW